MVLTEPEIKRREEVANAYMHMFDMFAWKDFRGFMENYKDATVREFMQIKGTDVAFEAGRLKGILECLVKIENELDYKTILK